MKYILIYIYIDFYKNRFQNFYIFVFIECRDVLARLDIPRHRANHVFCVAACPLALLAAQASGMSCMLVSQLSHGLTRLLLPETHAQLVLRESFSNRIFERALVDGLLSLLRDTEASASLGLRVPSVKNNVVCACNYWKAVFPSASLDGKSTNKDFICLDSSLSHLLANDVQEPSCDLSTSSRLDSTSNTTSISSANSDISTLSCWALYSEDACLYEAQVLHSSSAASSDTGFSSSKKATVRYCSYGNEETISKRHILVLR